MSFSFCTLVKGYTKFIYIDTVDSIDFFLALTYLFNRTKAVFIIQALVKKHITIKVGK